MADHAKAALHALLRDALSHIRDSGEPVDSFRGVPYFNTSRDATFTALPPFEVAKESLATMPHLAERFGLADRDRVVLQFIYSYLNDIGTPDFSDEAFEKVWRALRAELSDHEWIHCGFANVHHVRAAEQVTHLGRGISLRWYDESDLRALGLAKSSREDLHRETQAALHDFRYSTYVLVAEHRVPKSPDNLIHGYIGTLVTNIQRALATLRLLAPGDVGVGALWSQRIAHFDVGGTRGIEKSPIGTPDIHFGEDYVVSPDVAAGFPELYDELSAPQAISAHTPGNFLLALRAFTDSYDRSHQRSDLRVLDCITALEALLGTDVEISFRLAFRVAGILADSGPERVAMFKAMKDYYDTRSRLVHGGALRAKHGAVLRNDGALRDIVRRVLRAFVTLASRETHEYGKRFFKEDLDAALQDDAQRSALRSVMGLI